MPDKNDPLALTRAIEQMHKQMPDYCEAIIIDSRCRKLRYDALMNEGFTASQALELIKHAPQ